jgi:hypothetical protein
LNSLVPRPLWLIAGHRTGWMDVLTINPGDGETLPVFSFEEEAELFLRFGTSGTGWRVRETTAGELTSVLYGPCAGVEKVALDPSPEIAGKALVSLVSLSLKDFVRTLMNDGGPAEPGRSPLLAEASFGCTPA